VDTTAINFRELLTYMMGSYVVFPAFELILVAKNLDVTATTAN